jgi:hypothetical protein
MPAAMDRACARMGVGRSAVGGRLCGLGGRRNFVRLRAPLGHWLLSQLAPMAAPPLQGSARRRWLSDRHRVRAASGGIEQHGYGTGCGCRVARSGAGPTIPGLLPSAHDQARQFTSGLRHGEQPQRCRRRCHWRSPVPRRARQVRVGSSSELRVPLSLRPERTDLPEERG